MSELSNELDISAEPLDNSSQLDAGRAPDTAPVHKEETQPESRLDTIKRAAADLEKAEPEKAKEPLEDRDPKEPEPKAEEVAKAKEPEAETVREPKEPKPSEGRKAPEAPARFLDSAKAVYANTPRAVQAEIERMAADHEADVSKHREASERYNEVRDFDELARTNGTTLKDALGRYHALEQTLQENPFAGINQILMQAGPKKADGQPMSLWEIANVIAQGGQQQYNQLVGQRSQQAQQTQVDPRYEALERRFEEMQAQQNIAQLQQSIIAPFKASHPRYDELQGDIAFFLETDKVPMNLSPDRRLEEAYFLADRLNPAPQKAAQEDDEELDRDRRAGQTFNGSKSVKGAPASGVDTTARRRGKMSHKDAISAAMNELGI